MLKNKVPPRKEFFAEVRRQISDERCITAIEVAYNIAKEAHRQQRREDGERYFDHVKAVAWILLTETNITDQLRLTIMLCAALLHDIIEDTFVAKRKHLKFMFDQLSPDITSVAWEVTKVRTSDKNKKFKKLLASNRAATKLVKLGDRLHNQRTLLACSRKKIRRKNRETREIIISWAQSNLHLVDETSRQEILSLAEKVELQTTENEQWLLMPRKKK
ncbi:bifunctional (p)ppGpp synthetase/guanosine-3',5'-bis(diphosphate) 3'-pyrophosphohydrolase [Candidatus Kuenenbacteria bacterium]|nr:bifunctional (p)ppGpp synthetase/guanosine-3',5'-bis(diphosphate) 3'-pyrophosphohydrolase [Candidatus Kuenenbacteria bacterium]